jgi:4-alpha-glucanotransferase
MSGAGLHDLARAAGVEIDWLDVTLTQRRVSDETVRAVLGALGFPAATREQVEASRLALAEQLHGGLPALITAEAGRVVTLQGRPGRFRVTLESGRIAEGTTAPRRHGVIALPPLKEPGYHRLELGDAASVLVVAPRRAYTLDNAAKRGRLWGLAVQLYALRRDGDGGIGDFRTLAAFCRNAAARGADAVAISPVHAQFAADPARFGPYAPSSRAALNALHIGLEMGPGGDSDVIDWPVAGAARLAVLRSQFAAFTDEPALAGFRRDAGEGLERHAAFEAIQAFLMAENGNAEDWRRWPEKFRNPQSTAVAAFIREHGREVAFHAWLQYRADRDLAAAQAAARAAGMRIGLIGDLAVGTDPGGSHTWSRPDEVLGGLEIGAPPDAFNREGQCWGITAFSPLGLRRSGFSAFIEMLRHALRNAGGVRIDHVMGLARLWVVPRGFPPTHGAYLRMPVEDLLRLVALESHRHKAIILGEDLGTLPEGFHDQLDAVGIAGLRVLWFERNGTAFKAPSRWTRSAVAMTTTHDLPTVAGWWEGTDIAWRSRLGRAGDTPQARAADRAALWVAFRKSGATEAPMPGPEGGATAADAACAHLGRTACRLALLPVEDAIGAAEQPNLPGTIDEHPNWRRRLPDTVEALFERPDLRSRLAALAAGRHK